MVNEIILERTTTMFYGDTGIGKSTLVSDLLARTSCGLPVFGKFEVPKPIVSCYFTFERPLDEIGERLYQMRNAVPIQWDNLYLSDRLIGIDLLQESQVKYLLHQIASIPKPVNIVYFDPIYASVRGGLSQDEKATAFTRVSAQIVKQFGASVIWLHHTLKNTYDLIDGKKAKKKKSYYGGIWLEAHVNGSYLIEKTPTGTIWTKEKDSYRCLVDSIDLMYDPSTHLSNTFDAFESSPKLDAFIVFFNFCLSKSKSFTIRELISHVPMSDRYARELLANPLVKSNYNSRSLENGMLSLTPTKSLSKLMFESHETDGGTGKSVHGLVQPTILDVSA